jgi:hypothetical protein
VKLALYSSFASGSRGSGRKRSFEQELQEAKQDVDPQYKAQHNRAAGGQRSSVVLGPGQVLSKRSDADPRLPDAIDDARRAYPGAGLKAGHILNAMFYGDGQRSENLTILTTSANTSNTTFDNRIKDAVNGLKKLCETLFNLNVDIGALKPSIEITVTVGKEAWGTDYPDNCIFKKIHFSAMAHNIPDEKEVRDLFKGRTFQRQSEENAFESAITSFLNARATCLEALEQANAFRTLANDQPATS